MLLAIVGPGGASARISVLTVDRGDSACSDTLTRAQVAMGASWCSLAPAARLAQPGDLVLVRPGVYPGALQPTVSGTAAAPISFRADAGVQLTATVKLTGVSNISLYGFRISGSSAQGIWLDGAGNVTLSHLTVSGNAGYGIVLKGTRAVSVESSTVSANLRAGVFETGTSVGDVIQDDTITGNGRDGSPYNGDGIQLAGTGTLVARNTITDNGDPGPYEHGIYVGATGNGYVIEDNVLSGNAASDIKAEGAGTVRYNRLGTAMFGLVLSDDSAPVQVYENVIAGNFQHAILATTDASPSQAALWNNTIVQTGRSTASGNASALFVLASAGLDVRNNVICYTNPDNLGIAIWINSASTVSSLSSDNNWLCTVDAQSRAFAWNGSRVNAAKWAAATGQDGQSILSAPPSFQPDFDVSAPDLGAAQGASLGLVRDIVGTPIPASAPDIGAYQAPAGG